VLLSVQLALLRDVKPQSRVFYARSLTKESLLDYVRQFCQELGVSLTSYVILVAHFATAEIAHIDDFLHDFSLRTYNRALEGSTEIEYFDPTGRENQYLEGEAEVETVRLRIVDLFGFYVMGLDKVGKMFGLEKVSLEDVGGMSEEHWKANMDKLLRDYPAKFEEYARRDPEVTVLAYSKMREFYLRDFGIDVLHYRTTPGLAMAIFRSHYLPEALVPFELHAEAYKAKSKKTGEWQTKFRNKPYLTEEWHEPRRYAMLAYWGGRNESYARGVSEGNYVLYDVDSLYPSSAVLQPLPNPRTQWIRFAKLAEAEGLEGFARVGFQFPEDCQYPCLPIPGEMSDKIYFPGKGVSWCTLAEVREALRLGATITEIIGIGFKPGPSEVNHPLRQYAMDFMERKHKTEGAERETNKLLLNALIGKFVETQKDAELGQVLALVKSGSITPEQASTVYKQKKSPVHKRPKDVGSGWWIEAASLVLGKARALMSQFMSRGALMGVTDSVLLPKESKISCAALDELRSVNSDLKLQHEADRVWILRTRAYVIWRDRKMVKEAHHGFSLPPHEFVNWVEASIAKGEAIPLTARKKHLVGLKEAIEKGKPLGAEEVKESHPKVDWDQKRKETRVVNPFAEWALYPPQPIIPEEMRKRGRPRKKS
jgi:hypothetical protein